MSFDGCTSLKELKVSGKLSSVGYAAFSDGPSSGTITVYGTKEDWEKVPKDEEFLKNSTVVVEDAPADDPQDDILGDVNADGVLNTSDLTLLRKWLLAVSGAELKNRKAADLNSDGTINIADFIKLKSLFI